VSEAPVENTVKLLLPYVAWLAAERLHVSGVLAVLACGLLMSRHWSSISSGARLQARQLWDWLVFVLEGLSFVLVGVQLRTVVEGIEGRSLAELALAALALNLVVVVVRLALVYPASWLPRLSARVRERDPFPGWGFITVIGWAGMRGVVTLALARLSQAALDHLDAIDAEADRVPAELVADLLGVQREALRRLREEGRVTPEVARRLDHDLDVEEARLERERPS
jgi:NhaP-type Na+/H+ or K+/H+ antiporter